MRILLVDDSDTMEAYVRRVAGPEGWTLERARDGKEAMTRVLASPPDVILLDFVLPDMDGLELLDLFFTANVQAPSIVLTGAQNPEVMERFGYAGAADYLAKEDLTPARLRQALVMAREMRTAERRVRVQAPRALGDEREEAPPVRPEGAVALLVDDTATFRGILRRALSERGWTVLEAADAQSAIAQAVHARPDVILLDHLLPDEEGLAVLRAVREHGMRASVVTWSSHGDETVAERYLREGAVDYLPKDTKVARVVFALERALWLGGARVRVTRAERRR